MQAERVGRISSTKPILDHLLDPAVPSWLQRIPFGGIWIAVWLGFGMVLRAWSFGWYPLREDEALYGYWARLIVSGQDPMLERVAVDKPPFYLYMLANVFEWFGATVEAGRALNLFCSLLALILMWALARRIYGWRISRLAVVIFALSPYAIAFAPTLYTDPMLVAWLLLSLLCASYGFGLGAGLALGMAFATKQNALLFAPLVAGALLLGSWPRSLVHFWRDRTLPSSRSRVTLPFTNLAERLPLHASFPHFLTPLLRRLLRLISASLGFYYIWFKVWQWDGWRILPAEIPSFWEQSWHSYGGLKWLQLSQLPGQISEWWQVWRFLGGWLPGTLLLAALVTIVSIAAVDKLFGIRRHVAQVTNQINKANTQVTISPLRHRSRSQPLPFATESATPTDNRELVAPAYYWDILFLIFTFSYLTIHVVLSFQAWDRYLLGLSPLLALLAARGIVLIKQRLSGRIVWQRAVVMIILLIMLWGAGLSASSRIPIGGDHGAYAGIEVVASYLDAEVPDQNGVLYHRWLGWHWNWYLWDRVEGRVYWSDPAMLVEDIANDIEGYNRFIVFPGWQLHERELLESALAVHQLRLNERLAVRDRSSGQLRFILYEIVPAVAS